MRPIKYRKSCTDFNLKTYIKKLWKNFIFITSKWRKFYFYESIVTLSATPDFMNVSYW